MEHKDNKIESICLLSTHGYVDPIPRLGMTDTGGQVVYVLELAKALVKLNINVDIYTRWFDPSKEQIDPVMDYPNIRIMRIPAGSWKFMPKENIYVVLPDLSKNMIRFIQKQNLKYDLFHGHYVDAGIVTIDVAKAFNKPAFFTAHSLGAWKRQLMGGEAEKMEKKYNFNHRISEEKRVFSSINAQTVTTEVQKDKLKEFYELFSDNIHVIPPGVDVFTFRPLKSRKKYGVSGLPEKYIFCLSRIDTNKGHDLLIKAFSKVADTVPNIHLVIGGGSPKPQQTERELLHEMKRIITQRGLHNRVHLTGYIPDDKLVFYYQQAEIFVLPSIFEPFGMTALEAMACGIPVIASELGGIKVVLSSGENGLLVNPSNISEFADAMISLLKNKQLAEDLGKEGYRTVHKNFSWEAIAKRHILFYQKYLKPEE